MASFDIAIKTILRNEGGYVNHRNDPGGATNWGISLRFLRDNKEYNLGDVDKDGDLDEKDIRDLSVMSARSIYSNYFWKPFSYNRINSTLVATKIFDMAVNMGPTQAHKLVQRAVNTLSPNPLVVDGQFGPKTLAAVNSLDPETIRDQIRKYQLGFYEQIIKANPKLEVFRNGWTNRTFSC